MSHNLGPSGAGTLAGGDPQFVAPAVGDFRLQAGSPAVDAGVALKEVPTDLDGVTRPQGGGHDIGAYEYRPAAPK